jgi:hypothetical protein
MRGAEATPATRPARDFALVSVRDGSKRKKPAPGAASPKVPAKPQADCSPTWYGDTQPEIDPATGGFTGKLIVKYNDAALKDPCVRECVEEHEGVHVSDLTPIVRAIHDCDVAAGDDPAKQDKCNQLSNRTLPAIQSQTECNAYRRSYTCLTLKLLDPSNPCSRPPHKAEVEKHRGYEGCHLRESCAAAGTPGLGIPNA